MYSKDELQKFIGKYIFLLKDEVGYIWELEQYYDEGFQKAAEGIGYLGFIFIERKRTNDNKGIGFYKIVDICVKDDNTFAYVEFVALITSASRLPLYRLEILLFDILYSSSQTIKIDEFWSFNQYKKRNQPEYNSYVIAYKVRDIILECNCEALDELLQANGYSNGCIPDRTIKFLEEHKPGHAKRMRETTRNQDDMRLDLGDAINECKTFATLKDTPVISDSHPIGVSTIMLAICKPSKMMEYAKELSSPRVFNLQKVIFPELYSKLSKQFDVLDWDITIKLYDYFCRAHTKFKKYYDTDTTNMTMEDEMKMVLEFERAKKEKEKAEKKARRKAAKNK